MKSLSLPLSVVFVIAVLVFLLFHAFSSAKNNNNNNNSLNNNNNNKGLASKHFLDGCRHVFLDVGSNVGIQVRKLYEPQLYPGAAVLPFYDKLFGEKRDAVCAVGFEPNPAHTDRLKSLETAYKKCGFRASFWTNTGVSNYEGVAAVVAMGGDNLARRTFIEKVKVDKAATETGRETRVLRLARFVMEVVARRKVPTEGSSLPPAVIMKSDIEGAELEVLSDMLLSGSMQYVNLTLIEWHHDGFPTKEKKELSRKLESGLKAVSELTNGMFKVVEQNDESYSYDDFPLPQC